MATATFSHLKIQSTVSPTAHHHHHHHRHPPPSLTYQLSTTHFSKTSLSFTSLPKLGSLHSPRRPSFITFSGSVGGGDGSGGSGGGGGGGGEGGGDGDAGGRNRAEAIMALAEVGRSLDSIPKDLAAAIEAGRIPASIVNRFFELEKSPFLGWLLRFGGFKERLLADDLFLTKVAIECGVGIFTKTAAELEKRRENFTKELDFVFADVVMAIIADFMLVWLPAPTVSLRPPLAVTAGGLNKFFHGCPDNAFQIGTGVTNGLMTARKAIDKSFAAEAEDVPILSTSVAYGVYMAVSSNLR
ncbi:hypothetical protein DH2020_025726 [Rehmannia glutinosa]|uniref:Uncharacterized protein n=1 Tax=Rehmannia glutinosa TaxID=99300 RepID=A0ABR0VZU2_REHGL